MKEQIKLEEIVGYLPYGLKYYNEHSYKKGIEHTLIELDTYGFIELINYEAPAMLSDSHIKPILHPLSDLTKEIEVNGEKFVPIIKLYKLSNERNYNDNIDFEFIESWGAGKILKVYHDKERKSYTEFIYNDYNFRKTTLYCEGCYNFGMYLPHNISVSSEIYNQYLLFQKLYQWHFDIHNLIERGLGIDINTLEK